MRTLLRRLAQMVLILGALSFVLFGLLSAMPGNPVDLLITSNPRIKPEDVVRLKKLRGLDQPWYVQYVRWIWGFADPRRPPAVADAPPQIALFEEHGVARASVELSPLLRDPDYRHRPEDLLAEVESRDAALASELRGRVLTQGLSRGAALAALGAALYIERPRLAEEVMSALAARAAEALQVQGLFGAEVQGTAVTQRFREPGVYAMWFRVTDGDGLTAVGRVPVFVPPAVGARDGAPLEATGGGALDDERQLAGATEAPEPVPLTEAEQINAARAAHTGLEVAAIPPQVVDDPQTFQVDLASFVRGAATPADLVFELVDAAPGRVERGVYRHVFEGPGQSAISFRVRGPGGARANGAFSVEHGPIPDEERFNRGFLFVFAGDTEALGFSNTYKRPVWELLAGGAAACGDWRQSPGETCDDGNTEDGDGCSSTCQDERLSFWQRADKVAAGWLMNSGRIVNTLQLMLPALLFSLLLAIPIGVLSAYRQYTWVDYVVNFFAFVGISLPPFWFAIMVLAVLAEKLQWLPAGGLQTPGIQGGFFAALTDRLEHALMPAMVLSVLYTGRWLRYMRASMLEVLPLDFIRTARAKGLRERAVILRHALRNALIPVVTVLALSIPSLFGGALLTETVFAWPGIGRLQFESVMNNDYYVAIVVFLISSMLLMLGNLLADFLYAVVDPRIRKG